MSILDAARSANRAGLRLLPASFFLRTMFAGVEDGYVEVRCKREGAAGARQTFIPVDALTDGTAQHDETTHVWFGGATRVDPSNGTKANCRWMPFLWADCDFATTSESAVR